MTPIGDVLEDVWRQELAHVLGALLRRHADLGDCEDAAQEALLAASTQWVEHGIPGNPRAWLIRVASRRLIDHDRAASGARFATPTQEELPARVAGVLDVCHLVFTEGSTRTGGGSLVDVDLAEEAIGLTRQLHEALPAHDEVSGALALMLLTHARSEARSDGSGDLVLLREQDRTRWDRSMIAEGVAMLEQVLPRGHVGRFQVQAAIAAVHAEAPRWEDTDWAQILLLQAALEDLAPSPAVTLNRAVAVAMVHGPDRGLPIVDGLLSEPSMRRNHRAYAVRAHLRELGGDLDGALADYRTAAGLTASLPEQRYLNDGAARVSGE